MTTITILQESILIFTAFFAGLVDAVAGGSGLLQLPVIMLLFPNLAPVVLLSTNKIPSFCGSLAAAGTFIRKVKINWSLILQASISALIFSSLGAWLMAQVDPAKFKPIIACLLIVAALRIFTLKIVPNRISTAPIQHKPLEIILLAAGAGLYDGFFGPGTGTIIIYLLVTRLNLNFVSATAHAKLVNLATNFGAIIYFALSGKILWLLVVPMAVANILGGLVGAQLVMLRGNTFVRKVMLCMVLVICMKFVGDLVWG